jgi:hypothetical protein
MTIAGRLPLSALALAVAALCAAELQAQQLPPPPNDDLASAVEVSGVQFRLAADLGAATRESFEPYDWRFNRGRTAWWTWMAPADGIYEWDSSPSSNLVAVAVYQLDNFSRLNPKASTYRRPVKSETGSVLVPEPTGSFQAEQGAGYLIQLDLTVVYDFPPDFLPPVPIESRFVSVDFRKSGSVTPSNDNFANRSTLLGSNVVFAVDLASRDW